MLSLSKKFALFVLSGLVLSAIPATSYAQDYKGAYNPGAKKEQKDPTAKPIPRVISSHISNEVQGRKLDNLYYNLRVSLNNFAVTDGVYKSRMYSLLEPSRFKLTRYSEEFKGDLDGAMKNLNQNFAVMKEEIVNANKEYEAIKIDVSPNEISALDAVWKAEIAKFQLSSNKYFKLQNQFLNTYRDLVVFILKQGGSYYYKSGDNRVYFYRLEGYKYYGQTVDKLNKINFEQNKMLETLAPKNISTSY